MVSAVLSPEELERERIRIVNSSGNTNLYSAFYRARVFQNPFDARAEAVSIRRYTDDKTQTLRKESLMQDSGGD